MFVNVRHVMIKWLPQIMITIFLILCEPPLFKRSTYIKPADIKQYLEGNPERYECG